jgi:hypothetical protein
MRPRIKWGLLIGIIGALLTGGVATVFGLCGPLVALLGGAIAGFLAAQQEKLPVKSEGARAGAVAGGIAGGLVLIGQMLGGVGALLLVQYSGVKLAFGTVPPPTADVTHQLLYYASGLGTGVCFGLVGVALAALAGAAAGYLGTS